MMLIILMIHLSNYLDPGYNCDFITASSSDPLVRNTGIPNTVITCWKTHMHYVYTTQAIGH